MSICCLGLAWVPQGCLELTQVLRMTWLFTPCLQSTLALLFHTSLMTILEAAVILIRLYRRGPERSSDLCKATQTDRGRARPLALVFRHCLELFPGVQVATSSFLFSYSLSSVFFPFFFLPVPFFLLPGPASTAFALCTLRFSQGIPKHRPVVT